VKRLDSFLYRIDVTSNIKHTKNQKISYQIVRMIAYPQQPVYNASQPVGYSAYNNGYNNGYNNNYHQRSGQVCGGCTCCTKTFMCDRNDNYEYKTRSIRYLSINFIFFILPCIIFLIVGTQLCANDMVPCCTESGDGCNSDGSGTQTHYYGPCGGDGAAADDDFGFCASYCSTASDISYSSSAYCLKEQSYCTSTSGSSMIAQACVAADSCCGNVAGYSLITTGAVVLTFVGILCFSLLIVLSRNWHAKEGDVGYSIYPPPPNVISPSSMPMPMPTGGNGTFYQTVPNSSVGYTPYAAYPTNTSNDNRFVAPSSTTSLYLPSHGEYPHGSAAAYPSGPLYSNFPSTAAQPVFISPQHVVLMNSNNGNNNKNGTIATPVEAIPYR
jgi:hypothetical protein